MENFAEWMAIILLAGASLVSGKSIASTSSTTHLKHKVIAHEIKATTPNKHTLSRLAKKIMPIAFA